MTSLKDISQLKILKLNSAKDLISQWNVEKSVADEEYLYDKLYKDVSLICNKVLIGLGQLILFNGYIQWEGEKGLKYKFPYEQFNIEKSYSSKVNIILSRNILLEFSFKTNYEEAEKCYKLLELEKKINNSINQPIKLNSLSKSRSNNISNEFKFDFKSRLQFSSPLTIQKNQNSYQKKFSYNNKESEGYNNNNNNSKNSNTITTTTTTTTDNNNNINKKTNNKLNNANDMHTTNSWYNFPKSEFSTEDNNFDISDITSSSLSPFKPITNFSNIKEESNNFFTNLNSPSPSDYLKNKNDDNTLFNLYDNNKDEEEEGFKFFSSDNESNSDEDDPFSLENYDLSISSSEYKKSKEKLPPDEVKTNDQTTMKLIQLLLKWEHHDNKDSELDENDYPTFKNIIISYNYINLGIGKLIIYPHNLRFEGDIIKMQNQNKNISFFELKKETFNSNESLKHVILHFPYKKLSDIHQKTLDDNILILVILTDTIFLQFSFQKGFIKESNECIELIKNEVKKENENTNTENIINIDNDNQEDNLSSTPTTSKKNKKVTYSVNNQLINESRVNDLIATTSRKKTASPYTPSLSPLALRKHSLVTMNDILDKIETYFNNFSLLSETREESPTTVLTNISIKKKNNNNNNELIDKLYKAKIKIMEESKDILIKRINELYEEQLVKLKEEYTSDNIKKEKPRECQLCFDSIECQVIVPCGHKLCEDCAKRLTTVSNKCPWDRQEIESIEFIKYDSDLTFK